MMRTGFVKFYDPKRAFGFIVDDDESSPDVFVHVTALQRLGISALEAGQRVRFEVEIGEKGPKAINIKLDDAR